MSKPDVPADPDALRAEIEQTRAELGETVQDLAAKADVKARAKHALGDAKDRAQDRLSDVTQQVAESTATAISKKNKFKVYN